MSKIKLEPVHLEINQYDLETIESERQKLLNQITPLIDYFPFDKVMKAMKALDWNWNRSPNLSEARLPTTSELIECARHLLETVAIQGVDSCASGGFRASRVNSEFSDDIILKLEFIIEEVDYDFVDPSNHSGMTISSDDELPF